jgi:hypothetical protein
MDGRSDIALEHELVSMRFARAQFTIRSLMGVATVTAILVGSVILLLWSENGSEPTFVPSLTDDENARETRDSVALDRHLVY